jgi:hypothetical protein
MSLLLHSQYRTAQLLQAQGRCRAAMVGMKVQLLMPSTWHPRPPATLLFFRASAAYIS